MKKSKRLMIVLLSVSLIIAAFCPVMYAGAATVKTIAKDTYIKVTSTKNLYKITVSGEGYITLYGKITKTEKYGYGDLECSLVNSKKNEVSDDYIFVYGSSGTKSEKYAVSKGTYYIKINDLDTDGIAAYVKYSYTSVTQPTNYCVSKAKSLNSGTTVKIYQTPGMSFDRWYKINLTSNKKVTITTTAICKLYDSEGNSINIDYDFDNKYVSKSKLAKGTYYILVKADEYSNPFNGEIDTLKWS